MTKAKQFRRTDDSGEVTYITEREAIAEVLKFNKRCHSDWSDEFLSADAKSAIINIGEYDIYLFNYDERKNRFTDDWYCHIIKLTPDQVSGMVNTHINECHYCGEIMPCTIDEGGCASCETCTEISIKEITQ